MLKICVAGATGRMGNTLLKEAVERDFQIVGAVTSQNNLSIGKSLKEVGICDSETRITAPSMLNESVKTADVYITFTTPEAEVCNLPEVAKLGKSIVLGTTGFTNKQIEIVKSISDKVPIVFSPNFAIGVNIFFRLAQLCKVFPENYDFSIVETHHTGKVDAPSGTARELGKIISSTRGYSKSIYGREGLNPRKPKELEILSLRVGEVPGIHELVIAGPYEMLKVEHTTFSRRVFALGALHAAEWICKHENSGLYGMNDILNLR